MSRFVQLHLLSSYPPANLNRDDLGRPKTAMMGGEPRLRISSQSLKRAWRTSKVFINKVSDGLYVPDLLVANKPIPENMGVRSKKFAIDWIKKTLLEANITDDIADLWSKDITRAFGVAEKNTNELSQISHLSDMELKGCAQVVDLVKEYLSGKNADQELPTEVQNLQELRAKKKKAEDIKKIDKQIAKLFRTRILMQGNASVDIASFGRMMASSPSYNIEAAVQVAHAISVHSVAVEDDFFTAVDDLNCGEDDAGAAHLGETEFAAGLFYLYLCIDKALLIRNLSDNEELANKALAALIESAATVAPKGKQNSFGSRARTSYLLCETGDQQPRSLSVAFLKPVGKGDMLDIARKRIDGTVENMDKVYGPCADNRSSFFLTDEKAEGSLEEVIECAKRA